MNEDQETSKMMRALMGRIAKAQVDLDAKDAQAKLKCAIYTRVSTKKQAVVGISLDAQESILMNYLEFKGWKLHKIYGDTLTAKNTSRPQFQQMMKDAAKKLFDVIMVYKYDRFARNLKDLIMTVDEMNKMGTHFVSATEQVDTTTAAGKFFLHLFGSMAEYESNRIGERTGATMDYQASQGWHLSKAPIGYRGGRRRDKNEKRKHLEVDPGAASMVRKIFESYLQRGMNITTVGQLHGMSRKSIYNILRNPTYTGFVLWKGQLHRTDNPPIVDVDLFCRVQRKLQR